MIEGNRFAIRQERDDALPLWWNAITGSWTEDESLATEYTSDEHRRTRLPDGGSWFVTVPTCDGMIEPRPPQ